MTDVHDTLTRSRNMSAIKSKDTKPEVYLRKGLFKMGFRFRKHRKDLPGKPDIVFPKYNSVIFVHGCFWHGHLGCPMFRLPSTRTEFWKNKIITNKERDKLNLTALREEGWRVLEVWECSLKGSGRIDADELFHSISEWIKGSEPTGQVVGKKTPSLS